MGYCHEKALTRYEYVVRVHKLLNVSFLKKILLVLHFYFVMVKPPVQKAFINLFHASGLFLYLLKTSECQRFSTGFRGFRKRPMERNGFKKKEESRKSRN